MASILAIYFFIYSITIMLHSFRTAIYTYGDIKEDSEILKVLNENLILS